MKLLSVVCFGLLFLQQTSALFHDWYDYEDEIKPYCKAYSGKIALLMTHRIYPDQLDTLDKTLLECIIEQNLLGYIIREHPVNAESAVNSLVVKPGMAAGTSTVQLSKSATVNNKFPNARDDLVANRILSVTKERSNTETKN